MGRKELLGILQRRAPSLGVDLRFHSEVTSLDGDLVVAADGVNSTLRSAYGFEPVLDRRRATYAWFGTEHVFESFTFLIAETPAGRRAGARLSVLGLALDVHRRVRRCGARPGGL